MSKTLSREHAISELTDKFILPYKIQALAKNESDIIVTVWNDEGYIMLERMASKSQWSTEGGLNELITVLNNAHIPK